MEHIKNPCPWTKESLDKLHEIVTHYDEEIWNEGAKKYIRKYDESMTYYAARAWYEQHGVKGEAMLDELAGSRYRRKVTKKFSEERALHRATIPRPPYHMLPLHIGFACFPHEPMPFLGNTAAQNGFFNHENGYSTFVMKLDVNDALALASFDYNGILKEAVANLVDDYYNVTTTPERKAEADRLLNEINRVEFILKNMFSVISGQVHEENWKRGVETRYKNEEE